MKKRVIIVIIFFMTSLWSLAGVRDVYIVFYATVKGKTGHVGVAVDQYRIVFRETKQGETIVQVADTVPTGELTYYDLWPNDDHFTVGRTGSDIPAEYYKLPVSSTQEITVNSLYDKGIPHKENYPCDGLLRINTCWQQDQWMISLLDSMVNANRLFNAQRFNCSDFVRLPLEKLLNKPLSSREFILVGWSTTPNKLYRKLRRTEGVEVIKNADGKASGSFIWQRVVYKLLHHSKNRS